MHELKELTLFNWANMIALENILSKPEWKPHVLNFFKGRDPAKVNNISYLESDGITADINCC